MSTAINLSYNTFIFKGKDQSIESVLSDDIVAFASIFDDYFKLHGKAFYKLDKFLSHFSSEIRAYFEILRKDYDIKHMPVRADNNFSLEEFKDLQEKHLEFLSEQEGEVPQELVIIKETFVKDFDKITQHL